MSGSSNPNSVGAAFRWVNQITSIGIELVVPFAAGYWLDHRFGCYPVLTILGVILGGYLATRGFIQLVRDLEK